MRQHSFAKWATWLVILHAAINVAHGLAHGNLGVALSPAQKLFVSLVIMAAPILAAILCWTRWSRAGALLLALSMAAACAFGIYFHYVAISPDHVSHLPAGASQGLFRVTAALLAIVEAAGAVMGSRGLFLKSVAPS